MTMLKALIVDDEAKARGMLTTMLTEHCPQVSIAGEADNVPAALKAIYSHNPNLVFLDIEMPGYTGFQLLEMIEKPAFQVIFTTAYSEYALKAFEVSAIDYLLKPIRIQKLIEAVARVQKIAGTHATEQRLQTLKTNLHAESWQKLSLPVADGFVFMNVSEIEYIEAEGSYSRIVKTDGAQLLVSRVLRELENQLSNVPGFLRCHRSFLINTSRVAKWQKTEGGTLILVNGKSIPINRESKELLQQLINL